MEDAKIKVLKAELESGIKSLEALVKRKADKETITYQTKVIQGTLTDLLDTIYPKNPEVDEINNEQK